LDEGLIRGLRGFDLTFEEHENLIEELQDVDCGGPFNPDAHDGIMEQFYLRRPVVLGPVVLPELQPACYMHVIDVSSYKECNDNIVARALPRLWDTVATVLYQTNAKCLQDFPDPNVKTFEWRKRPNHMMIRREGNEVIVGTYQNLGYCYRWTYFIKSMISDTGAWTEKCAAKKQVTTPVSEQGVEFDKSTTTDVDADDEVRDQHMALYLGRDLGARMLSKEVWFHRRHLAWDVEWETDGFITNAHEYESEQLCERGSVGAQ
jgi:hypothetical protein